MEKAKIQAIVDFVLKEAVNINELSSGDLRSKDAIEKSWNVMRGDEPLIVGSKTYKAKGPLKGTQLKKGMIVLATYNEVNQGTNLFEILGVTGDDKEYGKAGVKYDSVKEALIDIGAKTLKELNEIQDKKKYGYSSYLFVKDLESGKSGPWFYLYKGRWSRGSGAEKLSFVLMEETHASIDSERRVVRRLD
jgi:hypothetical protein